MAVAWLLEALTGWLGAALGWLAAGGAVWVMAWRSRGQKAKLDRAKENANAAKGAKDNRHEIDTDDDQRIIDILTGRVRK